MPLQHRRAVDVRGFVEIARNALQRGEQDDHVVAEVLPDREQDDRRHRPVRIAEPVDRGDAELGERVVDQAIARVEEIAPDHRDGDDRRYHRREQRSAEETLEARELRIEQQRRAERDRDRKRDAGQHEIERVAERFPEQRRLQDIDVVAEADEAQVAQVGQRVEIEVGQAQRERGEHRDEEERADDEAVPARRKVQAARRSFMAADCLASIQRRFSRIVSARASSSLQHGVGALAAAYRAFGGEAHFLRDAFPFGNFRCRLDALELIAERFCVNVVGKLGIVPGAAPRRQVAAERVEANLLRRLRQEFDQLPDLALVPASWRNMTRLLPPPIAAPGPSGPGSGAVAQSSWSAAGRRRRTRRRSTAR